MPCECVDLSWHSDSCRGGRRRRCNVENLLIKFNDFFVFFLRIIRVTDTNPWHQAAALVAQFSSFEASGGASPATAPAAPAPAPAALVVTPAAPAATPASGSGDRVFASPLARTMAREKGFDVR